MFVIEVQLFDHNLNVVLRGKLEELGQSDEGVIPLVEDGDGAPPIAEDERLVGPTNSLGIWTEVDGVLRPLVEDIPAGLDVRNLEVVADGLDVMRGSPRLGADDGGDAETEQVTHSARRQEGVRRRNVLKVGGQTGPVQQPVVVDPVHGVPEGRLLADVPALQRPVSRVEQAADLDGVGE